MAQENKHLEVVLDTQVESVNLAEEMCLRVAEAAGFDEEMCYRIGMSVREGVINAFHYGNQERPDKKIHLALDITSEVMKKLNAMQAAPPAAAEPKKKK